MINALQVAFEAFEKRSSISGRRGNKDQFSPFGAGFLAAVELLNAQNQFDSASLRKVQIAVEATWTVEFIKYVLGPNVTFKEA